LDKLLDNNFMRTIGVYLRENRKLAKMSLKDLSEKTKIKSSFIRSIEKESWSKLPDFPVVLGFVKGISNTLQLNTKQSVAMLRRDYPPKKLTINPKPDLPREFSWSPKLTFFTGVGAVLVLVIGYLTFQYSQFIQPPKLEVISPQEGVTIEDILLEVYGLTDSEAAVRVNDQPAFVDEEGRFFTEIEINEGSGKIEIVAVSRSGKETRAERNINK